MVETEYRTSAANFMRISHRAHITPRHATHLYNIFHDMQKGEGSPIRVIGAVTQRIDGPGPVS